MTGGGPAPGTAAVASERCAEGACMRVHLFHQRHALAARLPALTCSLASGDRGRRAEVAFHGQCSRCKRWWDWRPGRWAPSQSRPLPHQPTLGR